MGLSREVARAVGWINRGNSQKGEWFAPEDTRDGKPLLDSLHGTDVHRDPPDFTRSLDAALTLVPKGFMWLARCGDPDGDATGNRKPYANVHPTSTTHNQAWAATPALALCIAALKAKDSTDGR